MPLGAAGHSATACEGRAGPSQNRCHWALPGMRREGERGGGQGRYLARRVGKLVAAENRKFRRPAPHIFTRRETQVALLW